MQVSRCILGVYVLVAAIGCGSRATESASRHGGDPASNAATLADASRRQSRNAEKSDIGPSNFTARRVASPANAVDEQGPYDWASWLGPDGNGTSRESGLLKTFPAAGPPILWRTNLGTGYSGLSVAAGRLLTMYGREGRERIVAFDALSGQELWQVDADVDFADGRSPGPRSTPVVDGDHVYVLGASGQVSCLAASSGESVWGFNLRQKFGQRLHEEGFSATPLIDGPHVIIQAGREIFALDKLTGDLIWRALDEPMNHSSPMVRIIGNRRQLIVLTGSNLVGLEPDSGRELWRHEQSAVNAATPVVGPDDQIFTGAAYGFGGQLIKLSNNRPSVVYHTKDLAPHTATPIFFQGHLYGFDDRLGIFKCLDFATGEVQWQTRATSKGNIIVAEDQLILLNEDGELQLAPVSSEDYRPTAKARIFGDGLCYTAPTLANGLLYLRSDRELVCIRLKD